MKPEELKPEDLKEDISPGSMVMPDIWNGADVSISCCNTAGLGPSSSEAVAAAAALIFSCNDVFIASSAFLLSALSDVGWEESSTEELLLVLGLLLVESEPSHVSVRWRHSSSSLPNRAVAVGFVDVAGARSDGWNATRSGGEAVITDMGVLDDFSMDWGTAGLGAISTCNGRFSGR